MRKILKSILTSAIVVVSAAVMSVCVSAETEDVELPMTKAKPSNGSWGQSITYAKNEFDCSRITPDSVVMVEYELDGEWNGATAPVEFILQNYTTADPQIWAKVQPIEYDDTSATYSYDDIILQYGSDDLSTVDNIWLGDCGIVMKATKITITNCTVIEVTTTTTEATTTESMTELTNPPEETTAAATTASTSSTGNDGGAGTLMKVLPFIVGGTILVAVIVTVVIVVNKNKNRFY